MHAIQKIAQRKKSIVHANSGSFPIKNGKVQINVMANTITEIHSYVRQK